MRKKADERKGNFAGPNGRLKVTLHVKEKDIQRMQIHEFVQYNNRRERKRREFDRTWKIYLSIRPALKNKKNINLTRINYATGKNSSNSLP